MVEDGTRYCGAGVRWLTNENEQPLSYWDTVNILIVLSIKYSYDTMSYATLVVMSMKLSRLGQTDLNSVRTLKFSLACPETSHISISVVKVAWNRVITHVSMSSQLQTLGGTPKPDEIVKNFGISEKIGHNKVRTLIGIFSHDSPLLWCFEMFAAFVSQPWPLTKVVIFVVMVLDLF